MVAFTILMKALTLFGTVQSNHRKGIIMLNRFTKPNKIVNLYPSFHLFNTS